MEADNRTIAHPIERNRTKHRGIPVLRGTRVPVAMILAELAEGGTVQKVAKDRDLDPEQVVAALAQVSGEYNTPSVLVASCAGCPWFDHVHHGEMLCGLKTPPAILAWANTIPDWCPLRRLPRTVAVEELEADRQAFLEGEE